MQGSVLHKPLLTLTCQQLTQPDLVAHCLQYWTNKTRKDMQETLDEQHSAGRVSSSYSPQKLPGDVCLFASFFWINTCSVNMLVLASFSMSTMINVPSTINPSTVWEGDIRCPWHNMKWPRVAHAALKDISVCFCFCVWLQIHSTHIATKCPSVCTDSCGQ